MKNIGAGKCSLGSRKQTKCDRANNIPVNKKTLFDIKSKYNFFFYF